MTPYELEQLLLSYHNAYNNGEINSEELRELIQGLNIMEGLGDDAESLQRKAQLNLVLNSFIKAWSSILSR